MFQSWFTILNKVPQHRSLTLVVEPMPNMDYTYTFKVQYCYLVNCLMKTGPARDVVSSINLCPFSNQQLYDFFMAAIYSFQHNRKEMQQDSI